MLSLMPILIIIILTFWITPLISFNYHFELMVVLITISVILFLIGLFWSRLTKKLLSINNKEVNFLLKNFSNVKDSIFINNTIVYGITIFISQIDNLYFTFNFEIYSFLVKLNFNFLWFISFIIFYYTMRALYRVYKAVKYMNYMKKSKLLKF